MNDLNTIARLNSEATERDIPAQQANGKYVVAEYTGLHFTSYQAFDTEVEANAYACEVGNEIGKRSRVFHPIGVRIKQAFITDGGQEFVSAGQSNPAGTPVFETRRAPDGEGVVSQPVVSGGGGDFGGGGAEASYGGTDPGTDSNTD